MSELTRQINRASLSHSLMNGFSAILPALAEENDKKIEQLESDNAELRELVRDMFIDFANADYELKRNHGRTFMVVTRYESRMRELGIEVDG